MHTSLRILTTLKVLLTHQEACPEVLRSQVIVCNWTLSSWT